MRNATNAGMAIGQLAGVGGSGREQLLCEFEARLLLHREYADVFEILADIVEGFDLVTDPLRQKRCIRNRRGGASTECIPIGCCGRESVEANRPCRAVSVSEDRKSVV